MILSTKKIQEKYVTIEVTEYRRLLKKELLLECLREAGVANWDGHEAAINVFEELSNERNKNEQGRFSIEDQQHRVC